MKVEKMIEGIIYVAKNVQNGFMYVGSTTKSMYDRKIDHIHKAYNASGSYFQEAIKTYGVEAFYWEQIDTATSLNELAEKETYYIKYYDTYECGYNSDKGGGFKKNVYQYSLSGELLNEFSSLNEASHFEKTDKRRISDACRNNSVFHDCYWSYSLNPTFKIKSDARTKGVYQYDLDGNIIDTFESVSKAANKTGLSKTCISRCCRGERLKSGGFVWKYIN